MLWSVRSVLMLCLLAAFWTSGDAYAFASLEPCPDGVAPGDSWTPDTVPGSSSPAACMSCTCSKPAQTGFSCYSCGVVSFNMERDDCYVAHTAPKAPYPDCCAVEPRCPGDQGYDPDNLLQHVG